MQAILTRGSLKPDVPRGIQSQTGSRVTGQDSYGIQESIDWGAELVARQELREQS